MSTPPTPPDPWLRGPLAGIQAPLQPIAHAFIAAREDIERAVTGLTLDQLWAQPGGVASPGFHLAHRPPAEELVAAFNLAISRALERLAATAERTLTEPRAVGRAQSPSTVLGLLFHAAEHAARHAGQVVTTAKMIRGLRTRTPA